VTELQANGGSRRHVILYAVVGSLAGFLFGFDTIVISGAEQQIQTLWRLSGFTHGICMSAALWGTVLGAVLGGWPAEKLGRRQTLLWVGLLYFVSAMGSGLAPERYSFIVARFIGGLGVGVATVASPMYISEIAPPKLRGVLAGLFQFNIVFGILVAFVSNSLIGGLAKDIAPDSQLWIAGYFNTEAAWRWMLGIEALPAFAYTLLCFVIPESPRWLITHGGRREAGTEVFRRINPGMSEVQINELVERVAASVGDRATAAKFFTPRLRIPILLAFLIAMFNQLSGINAILYFAPRLLGLAGISNPLSASVGIGLTNLVFTFVGLGLIDRLGRKTLLLIGSIGYIASLAVCAFAFLSYPGFKVVSRAIDVEKRAEQVLDLPDAPLTPAEKEEVRREYANAQKDLAAATALDGYAGQPADLPEDAAPVAAQARAAEIKAEASELLGPKSYLVLISIMAFIAAHAVGQGTVIWVFISEIFPNRNRAAGQALGSSTHWVFAALITLFFPIAIRAFDAGALFGFFCLMMCLQLVWVIVMVPETKGVPLEEMQKKLGIE